MRDRYADELPEVLKGLSFTVRKGERVAIVGATGSGKVRFLSLNLAAIDIARQEYPRVVAPALHGGVFGSDPRRWIGHQQNPTRATEESRDYDPPGRHPLRRDCPRQPRSRRELFCMFYSLIVAKQS